ncbi:hypothetical protein N7499_004577 [Penicillium canescens]|nr:hypothetical protein N7499_004577 [Penicillium canescens]
MAFEETESTKIRFFITTKPTDGITLRTRLPATSLCFVTPIRWGDARKDRGSLINSNKAAFIVPFSIRMRLALLGKVLKSD